MVGGLNRPKIDGGAPVRECDIKHRGPSRQYPRRKYGQIWSDLAALRRYLLLPYPAGGSVLNPVLLYGGILRTGLVRVDMTLNCVPSCKSTTYLLYPIFNSLKRFRSQVLQIRISLNWNSSMDIIIHPLPYRSIASSNSSRAMIPSSSSSSSFFSSSSLPISIAPFPPRITRSSSDALRSAAFSSHYLTWVFLHDVDFLYVEVCSLLA